MSRMLLELKQISKSYQTSPGAPKKEVLNDLDLFLDHGESLAIMGPSGSGKSTLLNIIGALDKPDTGEVFFEGQSVLGYTEDQISNFRNQQIGFIFQAHHLLPQCTVMENVLIPTIPIKDPKQKKESRSRAETLINEVGLWNQKDNLPGTLSGGECQRVAVIRALINQPRLLLADEPTGSLDRKNALSIMSLLNDLNKKLGLALIVVTHSLQIGSTMDHAFNLIDGVLSRSE